MPSRFVHGRFLSVVSLLGAFLLAGQGCGHAELSDDESAVASIDDEELQAQVGQLSDAGVQEVADAAARDAAVSPAARPTALTFRVSTAPYGGRYAPRNIGAIWVETSSGVFVKTVKRWARIRARYLTRFAASSKNDLTDAVTGATLANHRTRHEVKWNLTDKSRTRVKDGPYRLAIELTDRDGPGALLYIPFTLGPAPVRITPAPTAQFIDMQLTLE